MFEIPDYLSLMGDADGGVELDCHECAVTLHAANYFPIAYHAGRGEDAVNGLPYFDYRNLDGFFRFAIEHAKAHAQEVQ
jgi:hypothetical protein